MDSYYNFRWKLFIYWFLK